MILIVVKNPIKPEFADSFPELVAEFTAGTRAEPGNITFEWFRSADEPNTWLLLEIFTDDEAGAAHTSSAHFQAATRELPKWLAATPQIIHINTPHEGWVKIAEIQVDE
jgi:quinol monooxygenase YgiN